MITKITEGKVKFLFGYKFYILSMNFIIFKKTKNRIMKGEIIFKLPEAQRSCDWQGKISFSRKSIKRSLLFHSFWFYQSSFSFCKRQEWVSTTASSFVPEVLPHSQNRYSPCTVSWLLWKSVLHLVAARESLGPEDRWVPSSQFQCLV